MKEEIKINISPLRQMNSGFGNLVAWNSKTDGESMRDDL